MIFMKNNYFPKQKFSDREDSLLYTFISLFNAWLKRIQLSSDNCFSIPSLIICCFWFKNMKKIWHADL